MFNFRRVLAVAAALFSPVWCAAQDAPTPIRSEIFTTTLTAETLADLPLAQNVYAALETTQPEVIADRFNSGGLNTAEGTRIGSFLGSWSQTVFRVGDVDISDPSGSGAALMFPEQMLFERVDVWKALMPIDLSTPALGVDLRPRRPTSKWVTTMEGVGTGGSLAASAPADAPRPVERVSNWGHASVLASGPLTDRLGIVAGGTWSQGSKFSRTDIPAGESQLGSGFLNLTYTPSLTAEWRTIAWMQRGQAPYAQRELFQPTASTTDRSLHLQTTFERRNRASTPAPSGIGERFDWKVFGAVTGRRRDNGVDGSGSVIAERLLDGPMPLVAAATDDTTVGRATAGLRLATSGSNRPHTVNIGADVDYGWQNSAQGFSGLVGELVDGHPSRVWSFSRLNGDSHRHATTVAAFIGDHLNLRPNLSLDAAIRLEAVSGSSEGAASRISWVSLLPRVALRWEFAETRKVALVAGYRRAANRLNLDVLAVGDPFAQTAQVSRWVGAGTPASAPGPSNVGTLIDRVGPGTGGSATFSTIDPDLQRPVTDEWLVGVESSGSSWLHVGLTGVARRESHVMGLVDTGVPLSSYSTVGIQDPGLDFFDTGDDVLLQVYNRLPSTFGRNQYLLTNPDLESTYTGGLELNAHSSIDRLYLIFGATAYAALGSSANRGFRATENDQDALGELFTDPNAATFARGRLFGDRGFTIKWTTVYRFPGDVHAGVIARYQDGQPFSRFVLATDLNQGPELVRPYANGGNRFTFTGTLDIRLQKGFTVGRSRIDAILDFYNLATRSNEVEEYVMTGPLFRTPTLIEPPHTIHLGLRVTF